MNDNNRKENFYQLNTIHRILSRRKNGNGNPVNEQKPIIIDDSQEISDDEDDEQSPPYKAHFCWMIRIR